LIKIFADHRIFKTLLTRGGIFLATHKSAVKRSKQNENQRMRNTSIKSSVKTKIKEVLKTIDSKDKEGSKTALSMAIPAVDKAAAKGIFHKKNASRKISRLAKRVNKLLS
jgi:small subunit ribosomal protein S20